MDNDPRSAVMINVTPCERCQARENERHHGVSEESLDEFIEIYERVEGEHLPREEARVIANNLVNLYRLIMRPPPNEEAQTAAEPF